MSRPDFIFAGNVPDHRMLVRVNGNHKGVALKVVFKGGKYRVRSAYILSDVQFKALRAQEESPKGK